VITTFSFNGCGLPTLPSKGMVPELGEAGPDMGKGGVSKTGSGGVTVGAGDPATPSRLLAPVELGNTWGKPAS